jgi:hypothetical protein
MLFYRAAPPLSRSILTFTGGIIRRYRRQIGSCWRKLSPGRQACWCSRTCARARRSPSWRQGWDRHRDRVAVRQRDRGPAGRPLPEAAPALADAKETGHAYVVIDGILIAVDRVAADRPFYSGKHRCHGMNLQVIASPDGDPVGIRATARHHPQPDRCPDLGHRPRTGRQRVNRAGR